MNQAGDKEGAKTLLDQTEQRARAMGARIELGRALWWRAFWLPGSSNLPKVLETMLAAEALFRAVPEAEEVADLKRDRAMKLNLNGDLPQATTLATEALSEYRGLGMQVSAAWVLELLGWVGLHAGDVRGTDDRLLELEAQARSTDAPESSMYFGLRGWLALLKGELRDARAALVERRRREQGEGAEVGLPLASNILREEDRLAEAQSLLARNHQLAIS
jgi:hypothetical protein